MSLIEQEHTANTPVPTPLIPGMASSEPINFEHLGPLAKLVKAIGFITQAPQAIAMQSVLAAAAVSVQHLADAETLIGSSIRRATS